MLSQVSSQAPEHMRFSASPEKVDSSLKGNGMINKVQRLIAITVYSLLTSIAGIHVDLLADSKKGWKTLMDGQSLKGWHSSDSRKPNEWRPCGTVRLSPQDEHFFVIEPGKGVLVNGEKGETVALI